MNRARGPAYDPSSQSSHGKTELGGERKLSERIPNELSDGEEVMSSLQGPRDRCRGHCVAVFAGIDSGDTLGQLCGLLGRSTTSVKLNIRRCTFAS